MTCLVRKQKVSRKWISNFPSTCLAETDFWLYNYFLGTYKMRYPGNLMPLKSSCKSVFFLLIFRCWRNISTTPKAEAAFFTAISLAQSPLGRRDAASAFWGSGYAGQQLPPRPPAKPGRAPAPFAASAGLHGSSRSCF